MERKVANLNSNNDELFDDQYFYINRLHTLITSSALFALDRFGMIKEIWFYLEIKDNVHLQILYLKILVLKHSYSII